MLALYIDTRVDDGEPLTEAEIQRLVARCQKEHPGTPVFLMASCQVGTFVASRGMWVGPKLLAGSEEGLWDNPEFRQIPGEWWV